MASTESGTGRPLYPRVRAPVYFTRTVLRFLGRRRRIDPGLGGLRDYTDSNTKVGTRLDIEVLLPDDANVAYSNVVVFPAQLSEAATAPHHFGHRIRTRHL